MRRLAPLFVLALTLVLAAPAVAVVPGPNGDIAFTSGRGGAAGNDDNAKIWLHRFPGDTQLTTGDTRHSHPAFSPDGMKVAYSKSVTGAGARDIWVRDLKLGTEFNLTDTPGDDDDRAAWSPDGTRIAYGSLLAGQTQREIFTQPSTGGARQNLVVTSIADDDKPVWSPDGQTVYFTRIAPVGTSGDIAKRNVAPGSTVEGVVTTADNDYQPALSPNGQRICFSRGGMSDGGANDVDVMVADASGANVTEFDASTTTGEFNCAWSPDGTKIAYVRGVFTNGALVMRNVDGSGLTPLSDVAAHFDGNPDWGIDPLPTCKDVTATVPVNGFVSIQLECTDPLDGSLEPEIATPPAQGNLGGIANGRVTYTPRANFTGQDTFTYKGSDGTSEDTATVRITVATPDGDAADKVKPRIARLTQSRKRWRRGSALPRLSQKKKAKVGTTFGFSLSEAARTTFTFALKTKGRRVGGKCRKATRGNRTRPRCYRYVTKGRVAVNGKQGANKLRFQGRLSSRRKLGVGSYRVTVTVRDAAGNTGNKRTGTFRIVKR